MDLNALFLDCKGLDVCEKRYDADDYKEVVVLLADLSKWRGIFEKRLGPAVKPSGIEPSHDQQLLTKKYGGLRKHQVLFKGKDDAKGVLVMFWPWEDKEHVTLKMAMVP